MLLPDEKVKNKNLLNCIFSKVLTTFFTDGKIKNDCWIALFCLVPTIFLPNEKYKTANIERM